MNAVRLVFLCTFMFTSHGDGDNVVCNLPWKRIGSGCYLIKQGNVSADTAFALCSHLDAYLVNLETLEEALLLQYEIKQMKTGISFFVGGRNINRYQPDGDWRWIKRGKMTKMTYFAFGAGNPNGSKDSPQDCTFFYAKGHYQIYDIYCHDSSHNGGYICEK